MDFPNTWEQLHFDMENCEQTSGVNMIQHGKMVWRYYEVIQEILDWDSETFQRRKFQPEFKKLADNLRLPDWFYQYEEGLAWNREYRNAIRYYMLYHDCGKPYCREVDEQGRVHFPNHAEVSYQVWNHINKQEPRELHGPNTLERVSELIRRDMEIHTIKAADVPHFCREPEMAVTLLLAGLAEIHANAEMFGGFDSPSFKIKYKQIDRRGKAICKFLELDSEEYNE